MRRILWITATLLGLQGCGTQPVDTSRGWEGKPRVIVMTDGEVDDRCSMVHFLLYANDNHDHVVEDLS